MLRARDQLLLDVSHELRSPLTRIKVPSLSCRKRQAAPDRSGRGRDGSHDRRAPELERLRGGRGLRRERLDLVPLLREVAEGSRIGLPASGSWPRRRRSGRRWTGRRSGSSSGTSWRTPSSIHWPTAGRSRWRWALDGETVTLVVARRRPGAPRRRPPQPLRAVLPRRPLALQEERRVRPGTEHLQADRGSARGGSRPRTAAGEGLNLRSRCRWRQLDLNSPLTTRRTYPVQPLLQRL